MSLEQQILVLVVQAAALQRAAAQAQRVKVQAQFQVKRVASVPAQSRRRAR